MSKLFGLLTRIGVAGVWSLSGKVSTRPLTMTVDNEFRSTGPGETRYQVLGKWPAVRGPGHLFWKHAGGSRLCPMGPEGIR